ncbi:proline-rich receptor-like protein kinase PERK4 isoform X2 [Ipomoea triloba]|uniref:proline-rich receptor-like protein kinase PERK4 isoform X2 n=2 Tax=Ipomoea triloba TaxID=35885 RepID=UPI00125CF432|nr:proline-rich receptor-like protein kinase PERK4 isoform X2 [Ipomoea triloba]
MAATAPGSDSTPPTPPDPEPEPETPPPTESPPPSPDSSPPPSSPPPSSPPPSSPPPPNKKPPPSSPTASPPPAPNAPPLPTPTAPTPNGTRDSPPPGVFSPPPPPRRPRESPKSPSNNNSSFPIIAGVAVAALLLILILAIILIVCMKRKKKEKPYYMDYRDRGHPYRGGEHVVRVPPPPGMMGTQLGGGGGGGWGPPPMNGSTEYNTPPGFSSAYATPMPPMPYSPRGVGRITPPTSLPPPSPPIGGFNQSQFTYEELAAATAGFSQANLLGQGGFGYVHKGVLPDGREVAVKSLKSGSGQGEREFQAEVEIISRVHHRHLVSLVGYCIVHAQRMLVYEFVPNKTLEFHLHGKGQPVMEWPTRLKIALGSARGLSYLHEDCHPRIIHRDIKSANILLDNHFEAMVADFGLAKLSSDNNTHVSTRVMGTFGYLAPEYASSGKLTEKSDVFSFGVMLLEIITGHRPLDSTNITMEDSLVDWARPLLAKAIEDGNYNQLADPRLEGKYNSQEMGRMVACAAASIRHSAKRRPKMSQIVRAWDGDFSLDDLNEGGRGAMQNSTPPLSNESSLYDTRAYNADMLKFKQLVLNNESNEFGCTTGEFGHDRPSTSTSLDSGEHHGLQRPPQQQQQQQQQKYYI